MATLTLHEAEAPTTLVEQPKIRSALIPYGVDFRHVEVSPELSETIAAEEIFEALGDLVPNPSNAHPWKFADIVSIQPERDRKALQQYQREHWHSEDEIRLLIEGGGMFHFHRERMAVAALEVETGDWIQIPAGILHWFHVKPGCRCRAVRMFSDPSGWLPEYTHSGIEARYLPGWYAES